MDTLQLQEQHIYKYLQPVFSRHGYRFFAHKKYFRQQNAQGFKEAHFSLSRNEDGQRIEVQLGVRLNKVERLVEQFLEGPEEQPSDNRTVVASLSRLYKPEKDAYLLSDERRLQPTCQEIAGFMQKKGFRFLESISKLRHLDAFINRRPHIPNPYMYNQVHRCFKGIAIASILHRTDFEKLVTVYSNYLSNHLAAGEAVNNFSSLVNYLRYFSFN